MKRVLLVLLGSGALLTAGCANSEEWQIWRSNTAHFASGEHINFSMRNQGSGTPNVKRTDIAAASSQNWWGKAVTVSSDQILGQ
ncbi:MAG: hypothetical protein ACRELS_17560 [Candidatus Rokuibacteriota bacterium]